MPASSPDRLPSSASTAPVAGPVLGPWQWHPAPGYPGFAPGDVSARLGVFFAGRSQDYELVGRVPARLHGRGFVLSLVWGSFGCRPGAVVWRAALTREGRTGEAILAGAPTPQPAARHGSVDTGITLAAGELLVPGDTVRLLLRRAGDDPGDTLPVPACVFLDQLGLFELPDDLLTRSAEAA